MSPLGTQPRREGVRHDPEGAAGRSGLQLDDEDSRVLKSVDRGSPDEQPRGRVSKLFGRAC